MYIKEFLGFIHFICLCVLCMCVCCYREESGVQCTWGKALCRVGKIVVR